MLIDDLITRGVSEPYRMFTSRAEYRLTLREDNADERLTPTGRKLGLVDDRRMRAFEAKQRAVTAEQARLAGILVRPGDLTAADRKFLGDSLGESLARECRASELLRRPGLDYESVSALSMVGGFDAAALGLEGPDPEGLDPEEYEQVRLKLDVEAKYSGYVERQEREIARQARQETLRLPEDIVYAEVDGLSNEARQRLESIRPVTLGQASRLEGVTPSAVSLLLIHLKRRSAMPRKAAGAGR